MKRKLQDTLEENLEQALNAASLSSQARPSQVKTLKRVSSFHRTMCSTAGRTLLDNGLARPAEEAPHVVSADPTPRASPVNGLGYGWYVNPGKNTSRQPTPPPFITKTQSLPACFQPLETRQEKRVTFGCGTQFARSASY